MSENILINNLIIIYCKSPPASWWVRVHHKCCGEAASQRKLHFPEKLPLISSDCDSTTQPKTSAVTRSKKKF